MVDLTLGTLRYGVNSPRDMSNALLSVTEAHNLPQHVKPSMEPEALQDNGRQRHQLHSKLAQDVTSSTQPHRYFDPAPSPHIADFQPIRLQVAAKGSNTRFLDGRRAKGNLDEQANVLHA